MGLATGNGELAVHPVAFHIAGYPFRFAGLLYLAAVIVGWVYAARVARRRQWDIDLVLPGVAVVVAAAYLGARMHGAMRDWDLFADDPLSQLQQSGNLSFFGGLLLGAIVMTGFLRWVKLPVGEVADELAPVAPIVYAIFRLGCFLNGDDYGVPTTLPWGISFPNGSPPTAERVHPVQLYEIALMVPVWLALRRPGYRNMPAGTRAFDLCLFLGLERFFIEFLRAGYLNAAQWFALALVGVGVTGRFRLRFGHPQR